MVVGSAIIYLIGHEVVRVFIEVREGEVGKVTVGLRKGSQRDAAVILYEYDKDAFKALRR